mmetsp:Transcript_55689/g.62320  ORF Transcript_55689/g.62320 Transcript_55689/m.62320 type:complete len:100 (-) Transcript_55689:320-619(-)
MIIIVVVVVVVSIYYDDRRFPRIMYHPHPLVERLQSLQRVMVRGVIQLYLGMYNNQEFSVTPIHVDNDDDGGVDVADDRTQQRWCVCGSSRIIVIERTR